MEIFPKTFIFMNPEDERIQYYKELMGRQKCIFGKDEWGDLPIFKSFK